MKTYLTPLLCMALVAAGCGKKVTPDSATPDTPEQISFTGSSSAFMPKATIFKMNGDYADNVAVTLNAEGNLAYFPAPTDLSSDSAPYSLGNGWYLNRQGLSPNSVFTKWTFEEYRAMAKAPTPTEIKAAIIPGARVTDFRQLPVKASEALSDPNICKKYIE